MDYITASGQEGRFLAEEAYEWHKNGPSEDGVKNLEAPRKWRRLKERPGHGTIYGMRLIIYGDCIVPHLVSMLLNRFHFDTSDRNGLESWLVSLYSLGCLLFFLIKHCVIHKRKVFHPFLLCMFVEYDIYFPSYLSLTGYFEACSQSWRWNNIATSPPYTSYLGTGIDYAIVSPGMPRADFWVQEFLKNEIPCASADYLVEYVCKPGFPLEKHVLYGTHAWAERSFANLQSKSEEIIEELLPPENLDESDTICQVCG